MSNPGMTVLELLPSPQLRQCQAENPGALSGSGGERQLGWKREGGPSENVVARLQRRKRIVEQKRRISVCSLLVAILGIVLMMASMELSLACSHLVIIAILSIAVSASTVLLLGLILFYHITDIKIFLMDEGICEWRVAFTRKRKLCLTLELLTCAVHPFPLVFCHLPTDSLLHSMPIALSLLMFLRVYLVQRVIFMYSDILNPSYQTIGSLSKISLKFHFVLKILMNQYPGKVLLLFVLFIWFVTSWTLSLCESQNHNSTINVFTSMWLIPITFLTIGYGDMVPFTTCGRVVCLITGVTGVCCTALLIAVIVKKLELNKDEKLVHNFMQDIQLAKEVRKIAADLIGVTWLLYKYRKSRDPQKIRRYHRDVLTTVCQFRKAKLRQRKLHGIVSSMLDISKMQLLLYEMNTRMITSDNELEKQLRALAIKVDALAGGFEELRSLIREAFKQ